MNNLNFGDIVLLQFPFTNVKKSKKRPALVIHDNEDGDIIVCRITGQLYETENDIYLKDWKKAGLRIPSNVRVHKIATLKKEMVQKIMGKIDKVTLKKVDEIFKSLTE